MPNDRRSRSEKPPTTTMRAVQSMDAGTRRILRWFSFPLFVLGLAILTLFLVHGGLEGHAAKEVIFELAFAGAFVATAILLVAKPQEFAAALLGLLEKVVPERFLTRPDRREDS